jgi:hypothetical protein
MGSSSIVKKSDAVSIVLSPDRRIIVGTYCRLIEYSSLSSLFLTVRLCDAPSAHFLGKHRGPLETNTMHYTSVLNKMYELRILFSANHPSNASVRAPIVLAFSKAISQRLSGDKHRDRIAFSATFSRAHFGPYEKASQARVTNGATTAQPPRQVLCARL